MTLAEATEMYQVYVEGVRRHPENESLREMLEIAEEEMVYLWKVYDYDRYWKGT